MINVRFLAEKAKLASEHLALLSTSAKNGILEKIARRIEENSELILKANGKDIAAAKRKKLPDGLLDRFLLNKSRLKAIISDIQKVASLKDHVGKIIESRQLQNGLFLKCVRVPLGVVGIIYEARPNVTADAAVLCLKSGNAVLLKGGTDALNSNRALVKCIKEALKDLQDSVQFIDTADKAAALELIGLYGLVDVIIPRGGKGLINFVRENSKVPVIETGASVVHAYVDEEASIPMAIKILLNAKLRRVSICNTLDSLLIHKSVAEKLLKAFMEALPKNQYGAKNLEIKADSQAFSILRKLKKPKGFSLIIKKALAGDYDIEFLDYILAIKTVHSTDEAIEHIRRHSLKHSETIITENRTTAERFLNAVDSACVYWNASTQFSDGGQFGLGAEIGISTQKLHVRGPFALEGLTSYKWIIEGNGQIRNP